ncbi:MAG: hypothetical protein H6Q14_51 [Bacteroidetes bacterium]|jgi:hypothetical protein|nr:hypothetical protein [Bacteroidota bacterium]
MKHLYKALILFAFACATATGFSKENAGVFYTLDTQDTEISITGNKIYIQNLPTGGKLQVFSVLGVSVAIIEVKAGSGEYNINLPKGYYIVKIGDVVRKVAIK